jgi:protein-disulfide isomerase
MASPSTRDARAERAAAALKERQRAERRRSTLMIGGVVLALVGIVAAGFLVNRARDTSGDVAAPAPGSSYGVAVGEASAPRSVVIYEDFLCPFCGELERATHADLARLADQGKVYVEYRPFNLLQTDYSVAAANAFKVVLDAAGPAVATRFHDELYADQPEEGGPYPDAAWLVDRAVAAGATEGDVRDGITNETETAWVERATSAAEKAGVQGTPTVLVDGKVYTDGSTVDDLAKNLVASLR